MVHPRCLFSYYGSKSKLVGRYPKPRHDTIVEVFAGAANYALRYHERQVILNELNPRTWAIWHYLLSTEIDEVLAAVPRAVTKGQKIVDTVPEDAPLGLVELMRANCNMGAAGAQVSETVTWFAEVRWANTHARLEWFLPKLGHWQLVPCGSYEQFSVEQDATWFVDPPYQNAGKRYTYHSIDYEALAAWCRTLSGQVLVCENSLASWLPFEPLTKAIGRGGTAPKAEVLWQR